MFFFLFAVIGVQCMGYCSYFTVGTTQFCLAVRCFHVCWIPLVPLHAVLIVNPPAACCPQPVRYFRLRPGGCNSGDYWKATGWTWLRFVCLGALSCWRPAVANASELDRLLLLANLRRVVHPDGVAAVVSRSGSRVVISAATDGGRDGAVAEEGHVGPPADGIDGKEAARRRGYAPPPPPPAASSMETVVAEGAPPPSGPPPNADATATLAPSVAAAGPVANAVVDVSHGEAPTMMSDAAAAPNGAGNRPPPPPPSGFGFVPSYGSEQSPSTYVSSTLPATSALRFEDESTPLVMPLP